LKKRVVVRVIFRKKYRPLFWRINQKLNSNKQKIPQYLNQYHKKRKQRNQVMKIMKKSLMCSVFTTKNNKRSLENLKKS
jgi:uridine kinase